jgi:bifunctional non-homologous end joining protein LigD
MPLDDYQKKRNFSSTPEPAPSHKPHGKSARFVVQKHAASHLHYDFRLEIAGVLVSWAVPKGPSMDPSVKRLAVQVEDHPLEYRDFEGVIPEGDYGGGTVMIWDEGTIHWPPSDEGTPEEMLQKGRLVFDLSGVKLNGAFRLIKTNYGSQKDSWLLMKSKDECAEDLDILVSQPNSVRTGRSLDQIARDETGPKSPKK